ncbi:conserved hypothetical protein [Pyrenophora tritici-repentis Pt-1C-BFP]|uniref:HTH La-type RNA-binding domain-containing protein n=1 Tax=Pyrenophora tritici-repentis (strain Pt-1C-BFP) TaxID=426418 RepID=B2WG82_PYRTR|nr:uncharacterized protein PTRG_08938 [Pyrenophora tritici-repentis Pt-1C-BFP]EDU41989.1 conserved hypothetical protein [Pyrenophora tritici-repentis Pt-1C-BFP]
MAVSTNAPVLTTAAAASNETPSSDSANPVKDSEVQDPPDGADIRRQVEFYFSDENLRYDLHMLQNCGGRANNPVSINRLCGFGKMRQFKPKSKVPIALRLSAFLEVTDDGKQVKRRVPLQGKCLLDPDFDDDPDFAYDERVQKKPIQKPAQFPVPPLPQEKTKYPNGLSKNMLKPTGFEEGFVELALTPNEAEVEEEMYSPDKHFVERYEIAIQRFKQKASSSWYPTHYSYGVESTKNACQVPRSFFRYLRYHSVCPEYDDQLAAALKICDLAEKELPKVNDIIIAMPGDFNKSASVVFGGAQADIYLGNKPWAQAFKEEGVDIEEIGMRDEEARVKFRTGIAVLGSDEQFDMLEGGSLNVLSKVSACLEVTAIQLPTEETKIKYDEMNRMNSKLILKPLGKLICKDYEFWLEEDILEDCFIGLKINADILVLPGLTILDEVKDCMCSFYTWIPNELGMPKEVRWREDAV